MHTNLRQMLSAQMIAVTIAVTGGVFLAEATHQLQLIPGLFVLIPGFLSMRGNISGPLAGRLSSALHIGRVTKPYTRSNVVWANIVTTALLTLVISVVVGVLALGLSWVVFEVYAVELVWVAVLGGVLSSLVMTPLTVVLTVQSFEHGIDPDNVVGPYITSLGDVVSVLSILAGVILVAG